MGGSRAASAMAQVGALAFSLVLTAAFSVAAQPTRLTLALVAGEEEMPAWQGLADAWNAQSETVKVDVQRVVGGWEEYRQKMLVAVAAGTPPDIGRMGVALMPAMEEAGALVDLYPYARADRRFDARAYFPAAIDQYLKDGHLYGMPISLLTLAGYVNQDLFANRGVPLPDRDWAKSWTWDEWTQTLRKVASGNASDQNRTLGIFIEVHPERSIQYFWQNGTSIISDDRKRSLYNERAAVDVLRFMARLMHEHRVAWTPAAGAGALDLYKAGRLGMFVDGPWMLPWLHTLPLQTAVLPLPRGPVGPATVNFIDAYVVFKGSKHPEAAWQVIRFFTERQAVAAQIKAGSTGIPVRRDLAMERLNALFAQATPAERQVWIDSVAYSRPMPFTANWSELLSKAIMPQMSRLLNNQVSPEVAATSIHEQLTPLLVQR